MPKVRNTSLILIGSLGFTGVVAAAVGGHILHGRLTPKQEAAWGVAVQFHLLHAAAMLGVFAGLKCLDPGTPAARHLTRARHLLLAGTLLFAGSLYALCLGAPAKHVGPLTPLGGITLMLAWASIALAGF